jgi:hypothetical protein
MQSASPADDLGACPDLHPAGEHDPVFTSRLGTIGAELGQGEPVIIGAVTTEQSDPGARHCQGTGAFDVIVPASHGTIADTHDWEIGRLRPLGGRRAHRNEKYLGGG